MGLLTRSGSPTSQSGGGAWPELHWLLVSDPDQEPETLIACEELKAKIPTQETMEQKQERQLSLIEHLLPEEQ